jgi:hypothetical protein
MRPALPRRMKQSRQTAGNEATREARAIDRERMERREREARAYMQALRREREARERSELLADGFAAAEIDAAELL